MKSLWKSHRGLTMTDRLMTDCLGVQPWVHLPKVAGGKALPIEDAAVPGGRPQRVNVLLRERVWCVQAKMRIFLSVDVVFLWCWCSDFQELNKNWCKSSFGNPGPRTKSQSWTKGKGWTNMRHDMSTNICVCVCFVMFINPIGSMYGIFAYIYHKHQPNVGKYIINRSCGYDQTYWWRMKPFQERPLATDWKKGRKPPGQRLSWLWIMNQQQSKNFLQQTQKPSMLYIPSMYGVFIYVQFILW